MCHSSLLVAGAFFNESGYRYREIIPKLRHFVLHVHFFGRGQALPWKRNIRIYSIRILPQQIIGMSSDAMFPNEGVCSIFCTGKTPLNHDLGEEYCSLFPSIWSKKEEMLQPNMFFFSAKLCPETQVERKNLDSSAWFFDSVTWTEVHCIWVWIPKRSPKDYCMHM